MLLWDEYVSKTVVLIQIYSDQNVLEHLSLGMSFLMLMVLPLKVLNWLMLGDDFGLFP